MASISLASVSKVYPNGVQAVRDLDLDVADGELMVVVGPSGCGKTTALRMVAGLEQVTAGTIQIGGEVINDVPSRQRDVAMVFQSYALYPQMNVRDNIGFGLRMRKMSKRDAMVRVQDAAHVLGLTDVLDRRPGQLSGGQRQRVAMGRAIVREPSAFLMDEPLSNLDAKLRVQMRAEVSRVQKRIGVATIYVTHDQTEAMTLGHRVAVLRAGVLQQCDTPQVLYDRPANLFVAGFIGSPAMNLFEGALSGDVGSVLIGSQRLTLTGGVKASHPGLARYADQAVVVGIRPEDLPAASDASPGAVLHGDVELVEALGSELLVHFRTDARIVRSEEATGPDEDAPTGGEVNEAISVARVAPRVAVHPGERFSFGVAPERLEFFDPENGLAIWD
jgi:multiple sugar transport system ATP-binding protein